MTTFIPYFFSLASLLVTAFFAFRRETREDGQTTAQRLKKAEVEMSNIATRMTGFQQEIEGVADKASRDLQASKDNHRRDVEALKEQISQVPQVLDRLSRLETRAEGTGKTVDKMEAKMDRIIELLTVARPH